MQLNDYGWLYKLEAQSKDRLVKQNLVLSFSDLELPPKEKLEEIYEPIWDLEIKYFGAVRPTFKQLIGDCVAAARKQSCEKQQIFDIVVKGKEREFHPVFAPWLYAISRNQILGGLVGDGSTGAALAEAQFKYGTLFEDDYNVPEYSARIAREWGYRSNVNFEQSPYYKFKDVAKNNTAKYVEIKTVDELDYAILAGFFPTIASTWGFAFRTYHNNIIYVRSGTWYHQMYFAARKFINGELFFFRHNSWGDGHLPNPKGNEFTGGAWQSADSVKEELKQRYVECFAFVEFNEELGKPDFGII